MKRAAQRADFINHSIHLSVMKKVLFIGAMIALSTACKTVIVEPDTPTQSQSQTPVETGEIMPDDNTPTKKFTFTVKGDFGQDIKTKGYLNADGKDMTDLWVLDYMDGTLVQQLHQSDNSAEDFGKPVMQLKYGAHHIYFVASRGQNPVLSTTDKTVTFSKVLDTFWQDYEVNVVNTSNGNRAVTLDRVVTRLKLTFTDAIPEGTATFNTTPDTWYYGINYQTGAPCAAKTSTAVVVDVPSNMIGSAGETLNLYGFSTASEWTTNVTVAAKKSSGDVLGSATINGVKLLRNRTTEYSGALFLQGGEVGLTLNTDWTTPVIGTW